ncbi:esterase-like activity of phytase family protein [Streptomyces sp. NPDC057702]|uniref:caspase, EACC1-associated type n=1 Tax=unclassified Streptomyces TaxID=2593676 RepID=UPI0036B86AFB
MTEADAVEPAGSPSARGGLGRRIDPQRSACVLIGVSAYDRRELPRLASVARNIEALAAELRDPDVWGVAPERMRVIANPTSVEDVTLPIREAADLATDTLLIYYAGHGVLHGNSELHLTHRGTHRHYSETAVRYATLRDILWEHRATIARRVVILDCCYSGNAVAGLSSHEVDDLVAIEGSYVMTATPRNALAMAPSGEPYTAFTGALLDVIRRGLPDRAERQHLTLDDIHTAIRSSLGKRNLPLPGKQDSHGVGDLPFIRNRLSPVRPVAARAPYWTRARVAVATAVLAGVAASGGVAGHVLAGAGGGVERAADARPAPAPTGPCGPGARASLLSVSDALNQHDEWQGTKVEGLSALALTGGGGTEAIALRDEEPARLFRLRLGSPESLHPEVTGLRSLHQADGRKFEEFDGEGLVIEKGGGTVLVTAERGPALRRFDLASGRQVGRDFALPDAFYPPPRGEAQRSRSLESLTVTDSGRYLYTGVEGSLIRDADVHGRHQVRIQRLRGKPGGAYVPDRQFAYQTEEGHYLSELVAVDDTRLLALERGYLRGVGNGIRVYVVDVAGATNVAHIDALDENMADALLHKRSRPLLDLRECPHGGVRAAEPQSNPILENVEGMALGPAWRDGRHRGTRPLYLVSDNNGRKAQSTRVYAFAVDLRD